MAFFRFFSSFLSYSSHPEFLLFFRLRSISKNMQYGGFTDGNIQISAEQ